MAPDMPVAATVVVARDGADGLEVLLLRRPDRGSFAGGWVFPGGKLEPADGDPDAEPELEVARRAGVRETVEECGLRLDPGSLVPLSEWTPPATIPVRIRTWFFVAPDPGGALELSPDEVADAEWIAPGDALARHGRGEWTLFPPTWVTLHDLTAHSDVAGVLATASVAGVRGFETLLRDGPEGPMALWTEDGQYLDPQSPSAARHRLMTGEPPWTYLREA